MLLINVIPFAGSTGIPLEELEELLEELEELLDDELLPTPELEDDDVELLEELEDDPPEELLPEDELLPGVIPPLVQPCRANAPAANNTKAIFFI